MMSTPKFLLVLTVFSGLMMFPMLASAELPAEPTTYKLAMSKKAAEAKLEKGIEDAIAGMNFIIRPIARSRLNSTNEVYQSITVGKNGENISIKYNNDVAIVKPNGKPQKWKRDDGEVFTVTHKTNGKVLTQKFVAEDGVKTLTFVFSKDFSKMNVTVKLESEKLDKPMVYMISYKK